MKKFISKSMGAKVLLSCAALLLLLLACKTEPAVPTYKVTIDANGGSGFAASYEVKEGETLTIPETITGPKNYNNVKDYINTSDNTVFTMGETKVNNDLTLKVEWGIDLNVIRDMLVSGTGIWEQVTPNYSLIYTFKKKSDSSLDMSYNILDPPGLNSDTTLYRDFTLQKFESSFNSIPTNMDYGLDMLTTFSKPILVSSFTNIKSISDTELVLTNLKSLYGINLTLTKRK